MTLSLLGGFMALSSVCSVALYAFVRHALVQQFDETLRGRANAFAAMSEHESRDSVVQGESSSDTASISVEFDFVERGVAEFEASVDPLYYQVWDARGEVLARSPSTDGRDLYRPRSIPESIGFLDTLLPDGRCGRSIYLWFSPWNEVNNVVVEPRATAPRLLLALARSRESLDTTLQLLLLGFIATAGVLAFGSAAIVRMAIARGLRPLDAISSEAARIEADTLDRRFETHGLPSELRPICERLNEVMARLEAAFLRERRFTSNAAHELRTPVAELRALAEDGLRTCSLPMHQSLKEHFRDALNIAEQVERLLTVLLGLARAQNQQLCARIEAVDLVRSVQSAWDTYMADAASRALAIDWQLPQHAEVCADHSLLKSMLENLIANAVRYTPRGGTIRIFAETCPDSVVLSVVNPAPEVTAADLSRFFEPFWRKDTARSDHSRLGIGLSIARCYAQLMSGSLEAHLSQENSVELRLHLPHFPCTEPASR
jgi:two-component system sensor histidine kinase QseC